MSTIIPGNNGGSSNWQVSVSVHVTIYNRAYKTIIFLAPNWVQRGNTLGTAFAG